MKKSQTNSVLITIVVAVVVGALAFYGGMQYQKSQQTSMAGNQYFTGGSGGQGGRSGFGGGGRFGNGNRPVSGEIVSQDDKSITVKLQDGSTKIILLSDKTTINKAETGSVSDLKTGQRVTAFGTTNSDGSVTAQMVSLGGQMMFRGGMPGGGNSQTPPQGQNQ